MAESRELGIGETYAKFFYEHMNGTTGVSSVIRIAGPLTKNLAKQAMILLQERHPLLRAFFSKSKSGMDCLVVDDKPRKLPLEILTRASGEQWREVYEKHLNEPFLKEDNYLWSATLLFNEDNNAQEHELIASFHHAIIDGKSIGCFYRDLLEYCRAIAGGKAPEIKSQPFLPCVEAMEKGGLGWEEYLKASEQEFGYLMQIAGDLYAYEVDVPLHERRTKVICREVNSDQLSQILGMARENQATLTSILSAALMLAVHKAKGESKDRMQTTFTPVDMRSHCDPVVGSEHIGNFTSAVRNIHMISRELLLWDLARAFRRQITLGIEEQARHPKDYDTKVQQEMLGGMNRAPLNGKYALGASVTNYGVLDLPECCGPFEVRFLYSGAARHAGDWLTLLHAASIAGKLYACFCYEEPLLSPDTTQKIVDEFDKLLDWDTASSRPI